MRSQILAIAALLTTAAAPAQIVTGAQTTFTLDDVQPLADATLADQRGGFEIAGLSINLAADLKTYVNGDLALRTVVTWTASGQTKEVWASPALAAATASQLQGGSFGSIPISVRLNGQPAFLTNNGETLIAQRVDGGVQNIVLNAASNTAIAQQADITLDVGGYAAFAAQLAPQIALGGLSDVMSAAAVNAAPH